MSARTYLGTVRVALLDDHALVLKGLTAHLEGFPSIHIVGCHATSHSLRTQLQRMPVDVALIDYALAMDDTDGVALVRTLRAAHPRLKVLVISAHGKAPLVRSLLQAGAHGFVHKGQEPDDVVRAIDAVMTDRIYLPPRLQDHLDNSLDPRLSPREMEVIRCLLDGISVSEIAEKFGRSLKTISAQKSSAYRKLKIERDVELFQMRDHILAMGSGTGD